MYLLLGPTSSGKTLLSKKLKTYGILNTHICALFRLSVSFIFLLKHGSSTGKIERYDNCSLFIKGYCLTDLVRACPKTEIYFSK